ncbi:MAG: VacJ family lipoprotein [Sulfurovum sp.]|nr:VacJ family lipoprotein [Sulfurovum sp.]
MKTLTYTLIPFLFIFQACGTQEAQPPKPDKTLQTNTSNNTETNLESNDLSNTPLTSTDANGFDDEFQEEHADLVDPLSGYNRAMTTVNDKMYIYGLNPLSKTYAAILPEPIRIGISNAIKNLQYPIRLSNNLLQGKFKNAADETERFLTNSTVGLLGFMDPATNLVHVPVHKEDFGQTLGFYGVGAGFHVVLPFFGPSNVRDIAGLTLDAYASPLVNIKGFESYKIPDNFGQSAAIATLYYVNKNSLELGQYESLKEDAIELYPFLRDIYEEKRQVEIDE